MMILLCVFLLGLVSAQQTTYVERAIDISGECVRTETTYHVADLTGSYTISVPLAQLPHLAYFKAVSSQSQQALPYSRTRDTNEYANFAIATSNREAVIQTYAVYTSLLHPSPSEIHQTQAQFQQYSDTCYVPTVYRIEKQVTRLALGTSNVQSFTKLAPYGLSGTELTLGPYLGIDSCNSSLPPFTVHYENNSPILHAAVSIREIEVSHWGNVAFEEFMEVHHRGAKLKGGFSRLEYMTKKAPTAVSNLMAILPRGAQHIYYRDQIGNISTSMIRYMNNAVHLYVEPRFPLFGGWKTAFYQGYNVPIQNLVTSSSKGHYTMTVPFSTPYAELITDDLTVKVILPEWARDIKVDLPIGVQESRTSRLTFLDIALSGGRPVIILKKSNVVTEHNVPLTVSYTFQPSYMLLEPCYLVLAALSFFAVCILVMRVDLRIRVTTQPSKKTL